jgi:hypothetical protein
VLGTQEPEYVSQSEIFGEELDSRRTRFVRDKITNGVISIRRESVHEIGKAAGSELHGVLTFAWGRDAAGESERF